MWLYSIFIKFVSGVVRMIHSYITPSSLERERGHHVIKYKHNGKEYRVLYKHSHKHDIPTMIKNTEGTDITSQITPYLGPFHDFHGMQISPKDLGFDHLKIELLRSGIKEFNNDDIIKF